MSMHAVGAGISGIAVWVCVAMAGTAWAQAPADEKAAPPALLTPSGEAAPAQGWKATDVVTGLRHPWGIAWLPDGSMLITEREGRVRRASAAGVLDATPLAGVPAVAAVGQGGLMDVALHPKFAENSLVYFTYSAGSRNANRTTLARARLDGNELKDWRVLFQVSREKAGGQHFGSRILWLGDGTLLLSIGDGGNPPVRLDGSNIRNLAQSKGAHFGKVLRLTDEGAPARDNPFVGEEGALPEVWSYGHRNIQGMALDPASGRVWANEHGARGGDELNLIEKGANYGWPVVTYSREYAGPEITTERSRAGIHDPKIVWTPAQAPSGLAFYTGDKFPAWKGNLFSGGLVTGEVRRIVLGSDGVRVEREEVINIGSRVRDVRQGPDGLLYVLTDEGDGRLIRIEPSDK